MGLRFANPIGLAAGLDKNGIAALRWQGLGFGFAELGTVTPKPQPGNPQPRLFRIPAERAIINRMGFNNAGAEALAARLQGRQFGIPIGINLGKNKTSEDAPADYRRSFELLGDHGDYFVINVSSPNTPGLRALQEKGALLEIIAAMQGVRRDKPILVKVAPDLGFPELDDVLDVVHQTGLSGIIATNTTLDRSVLRSDPQLEGGLSGAPLLAKSTAVLSYLASNKPEGCALIGVGGVFSAEDARAKLDAGADLVQVYSGWIYGGPATLPRILLGLLGEG